MDELYGGERVGSGRKPQDTTGLSPHGGLGRIRTTINFDSMTTVARAIHEIKTYLNMAVIPLTLQRLEMLCYKPPSGQSQTVTTQHLIQMFCECEGFTMTPEETLIICMLNTITDNALMVKSIKI